VIDMPNYTQIPNVYFDEIMQHLNGSENLVFLVIMRKTFGWKKNKDKISYTQIIKMSGLAKSTVCSALKTLEEMGYIILEKNGQSIFYSVNISDVTGTKIEPVRKSNRYENRTGTVPKIEPVEEKTVPKIEHTKEKNINKTKEIYCEIENAYIEAFKTVLPKGEPFIDYPKVRARQKALLTRMTKEKIIQAINAAKKDEWIISNGFSLMVILGDFQLNKLLNGKPYSPQKEFREIGSYSRPRCECGGEINPGGFCTRCGKEIS